MPPLVHLNAEPQKSTTFLFDNQYVQQPQHDKMKPTLLNNYSVKSISLWENHYLFAFYLPKSVVSAIPAVRKTTAAIRLFVVGFFSPLDAFKMHLAIADRQTAL